MNHVMMVAPNTYAAQSYYAEKVVMKMNQNAKTAQPYKPSEGRLLTDEEMGNVRDKHYYETGEVLGVALERAISEAQDAKTASMIFKEIENQKIIYQSVHTLRRYEALKSRILGGK